MAITQASGSTVRGLRDSREGESATAAVSCCPMELCASFSYCAYLPDRLSGHDREPFQEGQNGAMVHRGDVVLLPCLLTVNTRHPGQNSEGLVVPHRVRGREMFRIKNAIPSPRRRRRAM